MADTALALISEQPDVLRLMRLLRNNNMETPRRDFSQLLNYVDTMEKQLNTVLGELNSVRQQLDEIKDKQHPVRTACMKMLNALEANVNEAKARLNDVKDAIVEGAKNALAAFKEKGLSALNSVMSFFKVQKGLDALRSSVDKSITSAEKSIAQIDKISVEVHTMGSQARNVGRAIRGKETQQDVKANGIIAKIVQSPFRAIRATMSGVKKIVSAAISKLNQLDRTVQQNREKVAAKEQKPSILDNVKNYKPPAKAADASTVDKSKKREESL